MDTIFSVFMVEHSLKQMRRYCEHDDNYEMSFVAEDGREEVFLSSRAEVAARYGDESKEESVRHFDKMAMEWYAEKKK